MADDERPDETPPEGEPEAAEAGRTEPPAAELEAAEAAPTEPEAPAGEEPAPAAEADEPPAEQPAGEQPAGEEPAGEQPAGEEPAAEEPAPAAAPAEEAPADAAAKPEIPGADLEVDIVPEGYDPLAQEGAAAEVAEEAEAPGEAEQPVDEPEEPEGQARPRAAIDLGADARYKATGKRKTAIARVILKPGSGSYAVNGHTLEEYFPRATAQRNIREPLETVGYDARMDVVASLQGGGVSAQAGALRHGIARALLEADPNLRIELKRRGLLTRDARVKERRKAGLKKARKRPQFSKR